MGGSASVNSKVSGVVEAEPTVKYKGRASHALVDLGVVDLSEFLPLRAHDEGIGVDRRELHTPFARHTLGEDARDAVVGHDGVVDVDIGPLVEEEPHNVDGGRVARVVRVALERKAHDHNASAPQSEVGNLVNMKFKPAFNIKVRQWNLVE